MTTLSQAASAQALPPTLTGLSEVEAQDRMRRGQSNAFQPRATRSLAQILRENTLTLPNVVLVAVGVLLAVIGEPADAIATGGLVLFNMLVGFVQEVRAKRQLDHLALLGRPNATVIRDGQERTIDPSGIVRGDLLVVRSGDQILVDGSVAGPDTIAADESLLTGESDLVRKTEGDPVYSGSYCMEGTGHYVAEKVGADSFANSMTQGARAFRRTRTDIQRYVDLLIRVMAVLTGVLVILFSVSAMVHAASPAGSVRAAAVILALIPQGLQTMTLVSYAMGAVRTAGTGVLVQQANAVESMSHVDVLCLDKTGTLTTNTLSLDATRPIGPGDGDLATILGAFVASVPDRNRTIEAFRTVYHGHTHTLRDTVPFSSERKWSAAVFDDDDLRGVYVLGAPEVLLPSLQSGAVPGDEIARWTAQGLRVLLFATAPVAAGLHEADGRPRLPQGLAPLALFSLRDELRPEAHDTLQHFADAGIRLKFISGDSPDTVAALVRQTGFRLDGRTIAGPELDTLEGPQFDRVAHEVSIVGRATPQHKERLVRSLRQNGNYVGMVGDGINDVLALKAAQLGIAMESGSQVARGVADIVLMNDSFAALPVAFREGRRIVRGILDVMRVLLTRTLYIGLLIVGVALVGLPFPVTPTSNSVVALLTVGIPSLALTAWAKPEDPPKNTLLWVVHFVVPAAVSIATLLLILYVTYIQTAGSVALARTVVTVAAVLCGLVLILLLDPSTLSNTARDGGRGDWRPGAMALAAGLLFTVLLFVPAIPRLLGLDPLAPRDVGVVVLADVLWAAALRWMWQVRLFERWLDLGES